MHDHQCGERHAEGGRIGPDSEPDSRGLSGRGNHVLLLAELRRRSLCGGPRREPAGWRLLFLRGRIRHGQYGAVLHDVQHCDGRHGGYQCDADSGLRQAGGPVHAGGGTLGDAGRQSGVRYVGLQYLLHAGDVQPGRRFRGESAICRQLHQRTERFSGQSAGESGQHQLLDRSHRGHYGGNAGFVDSGLQRDNGSDADVPPGVLEGDESADPAGARPVLCVPRARWPHRSGNVGYGFGRS